MSYVVGEGDADYIFQIWYLSLFVRGGRFFINGLGGGGGVDSGNLAIKNWVLMTRKLRVYMIFQ